MSIGFLGQHSLIVAHVIVSMNFTRNDKCEKTKKMDKSFKP
jgi:hypothetical protein